MGEREETGSEALFGVFRGKPPAPLPPLLVAPSDAPSPASGARRGSDEMRERNRLIVEAWNAENISQSELGSRLGITATAVNMVLVAQRKRGVAVRARGQPWPPEGVAVPVPGTATVMPSPGLAAARTALSESVVDGLTDEEDYANTGVRLAAETPPPAPPAAARTPSRAPSMGEVLDELIPGPDPCAGLPLPRSRPVRAQPKPLVTPSIGELVDTLVTPATMLLSLKRRRTELLKIVGAAASAAAELPKIDTAIAALEPLAETQYRCKSCEARWRLHKNPGTGWTWSLWDMGQAPGPCCDNSPDFLQLLDPRPPAEAFAKPDGSDCR